MVPWTTPDVTAILPPPCIHHSHGCFWPQCGLVKCNLPIRNLATNKKCLQQFTIESLFHLIIMDLQCSHLKMYPNTSSIYLLVVVDWCVLMVWGIALSQSSYPPVLLLFDCAVIMSNVNQANQWTLSLKMTNPTNKTACNQDSIYAMVFCHVRCWQIVQ